MNKKLLGLICIPSAIVLFIILATSRNTVTLSYAVIEGLFLGTAEALYLSRIKRRSSVWVLMLSLVSGALVCYFGYYRFYREWLSAGDALRSILTRLFSEFERGLRIAYIAAAIAALPSAAVLTEMVLRFVLRSLRAIDYKNLRKELTGGISPGKIIKMTCTTIVVLATSVLIGTALLTAVFMLPTDRVERNLEKSAYTIQDEGTYPQLTRYAISTLDNYTDSIMLTEAAIKPGPNLLADVMNVPRGYVDDMNAADSLVAHYIMGKPFNNTTLYARYWHGYLIYVKTLLEFMEYRAMRILNGIVQILLVGSICGLLFKRGQKAAIIPYLTAYLMLMPIALAKSFQYSSSFYVLNLGCLLLLLLSDEKRKKNSYIVFLLCGILTAYFDFLTYPISTFGVPMLLYLYLSGTDSEESKIIATVKNGLFWCIGLAGMWVSKWVVASIVLGENIVATCFGSVKYRTSTMTSDWVGEYTAFDCVVVNYKVFLITPITIFAMIYTGALVYRFFRHNRLSAGNICRILFPFFVTGLAPAVWYAFAKNHSMIHTWFTNKACVVSLLAVLFGLVSLLQSNSVQARNKRE